MGKKHKISKKIEPFITWYVNTSIEEDEETKEKYGVFSVFKSSPTKKTIKLVFESIISHVPKTLSELVALAVAEEISATKEEFLEFLESVEKGKIKNKNILDFVPEESQVCDWYQNLNMNDFVIWYDYYGQIEPSPEDIIEISRFYLIQKEVEEQIIDFIETEGENINE